MILGFRRDAFSRGRLCRYDVEGPFPISFTASSILADESPRRHERKRTRDFATYVSLAMYHGAGRRDAEPMQHDDIL